jgi:predicted amidophosphoribosyltransferase
MPTVSELTAVYGNFMISPRPGPDVCERCFNTTKGFDRCYACAHTPQWLDLIAPISYSIGGEQLHHALASYKRLTGAPARRFMVELAAVLWRHLDRHEVCIAHATTPGTTRFELVTTVPSSDPRRDGDHPLRTLVGELTGPIRGRYQRLLRRSDTQLNPREFSSEKYAAVRRIDGGSVLLIDDTWTTGANAQSAACALKAAGASTVAAVVIGRHLNRDWGDNDSRLTAGRTPFSWNECPFCDERYAPERARASAVLRTPPAI